MTNMTDNRPVDLIHLSKQTLGNRDLEREVLELFVRQSALYFDRLRSAATDQDLSLAAHTIKGSARGIGAWAVAECASAVEEASGADEPISQLGQAIDEANAYINTIVNVH